MIKLTDLLEEKMTPAQKKKRGEIFDKLVAGGMPEKKAGPIATSRAMNEELDPVGKEDEDPDNDGIPNTKSDEYILKRRKAISANIKEEISAPLSELYDLVEKLVAQGITKDEILRIVNFATAKTDSNLNESHLSWPPTQDHEATMAKSELRDMVTNASKIYKMIEPNQQLPGWVSGYITLASDYMHSIAEYLTEEEIQYSQEEVREAAEPKKLEALNKAKAVIRTAPKEDQEALVSFAKIMYNWPWYWEKSDARNTEARYEKVSFMASKIVKGLKTEEGETAAMEIFNAYAPEDYKVTNWREMIGYPNLKR